MAIILSLCGCNRNKAKEGNLQNSLLGKYPINNHTPLSELLVNSYSIEDLVAYFGAIPENEYMVYNVSETHMLLTEVDMQFPIECMRQQNDICYYSVYRVTQGGYFYVFWSNIIDMSNTDLLSFSDRPTVYFTAYLSKLKEKEDFQALIEGVSTAEDVAEIDPAVEISFLASSGIYSYSLLSNREVLVIKYSNNTPIKSRADLVVESMSVVSQDTAASSYLASIQYKDLP